MSNISFQLVTPEKTVLEEKLVSLTCPTSMGEITILPHHAPLVASLVPGELHAKTGHDDFYIHVAGGFVEVREGSEVVVLADAAEHHYEINIEHAEEALARASEDMKNADKSSAGYARVAATLERSLSRLNVARKHASRKSPFTSTDTLHN